MKKIFVLALAMGLVLVLGGVAMADTNTLTVQASVTGTCRFNSGTSTLNFGALDQTSLNPVSVGTTVQFWCTNRSNYAVTADNGAHASGTTKQMLGPTAADLIPYGLTLSGTATGTGLGKTTPIELTLTGTIANADYVNVAAGAYSDTVTLTITP